MQVTVREDARVYARIGEDGKVEEDGFEEDVESRDLNERLIS